MPILFEPLVPGSGDQIFAFDPEENTLVSPGEAERRIGRFSSTLLRVLLSPPNVWRLIDDLFCDLWPDPKTRRDRGPHNVHVYISSLRKDLGLLGNQLVRGNARKYKLFARISGDPIAPPQEIFRYDGPYSAKPATFPDLADVAGLWAGGAFRGRDVIPLATLEDWFATNPLVLTVLRNVRGSCVGNLCVLPLQPETLLEFHSGRKADWEFRSSDLFGVSQRSRVKHLYVESLVSVFEGCVTQGDPYGNAELLRQFSLDRNPAL